MVVGEQKSWPVVCRVMVVDGYDLGVCDVERNRVVSPCRKDLLSDNEEDPEGITMVIRCRMMRDRTLEMGGWRMQGCC